MLWRYKMEDNFLYLKEYSKKLEKEKEKLIELLIFGIDHAYFGVKANTWKYNTIQYLKKIKVYEEQT
jgi:hypothetical protein